MCNPSRGVVARTPAARDLVGGVSETYYERNVHDGYPGGRPWTGLGRLARVTLNERKKYCEYLFTAAVTAHGDVVER